MRLIDTTPISKTPAPLQKTYTIEVTAEELIRIYLLSHNEGGHVFPHRASHDDGFDRIGPLLTKIEPNLVLHLQRLGLDSFYEPKDYWTGDREKTFPEWVKRVHQ